MTDSKTIERKPLTEDRSIFKFIIFNTITFGIYSIWFFWHMLNDLHILLYDEDDPLPKYPTYLLYSIFTLGIYNIYYWLKVSDKIKSEAIKRRLDVEISGGFIGFCFIASYFFAIIEYCAFGIIFKAVNTLIEDYNRKLR